MLREVAEIIGRQISAPEKYLIFLGDKGEVR
jgi:hypothetical protein